MARSNKKKKKATVTKTRKELRKEKRTQKKDNKREFFAKKKSNPGQFIKRQNDETESAKRKRQPNEEIVNSEIESDFDLSDDDINAKLQTITKKPIKPTAAPKQVDIFLENQQKEKKKQSELQKKMRKRRIEQLQNANEDEDKVIRKLEKKLHIKKHKNEKSVHKMFNDGLDYALELCLPDNIEKMYSAAKDATGASDSEDGGFEEDLAFAMGEDKKKSGDKKKKSAEKDKTKTQMARLSKAESKYFDDDSDLSGSDSEFGDDSDADDVEEVPTKSSRKKVLNDSEDSDFDIVPSDEEDDNNSEEEGSSEISNEESESDNEENSGEDQDHEISDYGEDNGIDSAVDKEENEKLWEDIYGRKRNKDGQLIEEKSSKYVPPHIRARLEAENPDDSKRKEKLANLRRHCKGFLNRLSEANIHKIATEIENMYRTNSRFDMNNTLTLLVGEALISNVLSPERMVLEYAMLVSILHANIGSEIGAHFLQNLVLKIDNYINEMDKLDVENKEFDNTLYFLCHLYTFKIFHHKLIIEVINRLIENLCEKSVECLLLALRAIGFQLRKDDPLSLKDLILSVQKKANEAPLQLKENPRLKFMVEVLAAIKNNNMTKIPQYDPSLAEHLKKILKSMMVNGKYIATLNITMADLLNADEKGKWWVVGSAWSGNIKDINSAQKSNKTEMEKFSEQLLVLAKQQRMNTDDRRNVFCIIMSAEDYVNAFERLLHLSIKDQRVIVSVIIHCCLSEKVFNPYYGVLAQKFCEYDRKYQLAIQYALWDRIKEIHSSTKQEIKNLAQLLIYLITKGGLPVSVLKVIEFAEMDKVTLRLVRQTILGLLLGKEDDCRQIFGRIAPSAKLNAFKDSIRLFIHHFLLKGSKNDDSDKIGLLKSRINLVDEALQSRDSKVKF